MTEERRRDVCKHLNKVLEEHRTAVRNVRRDVTTPQEDGQGQEDQRRRRKARLEEVRR